MEVQQRFDLGAIGMGPAGSLALAILKAARSGIHIGGLEKHQTPERNHGLKIHSDSIQDNLNLIDLFINSTHPEVNRPILKEIRGHLVKWQEEGFTRTSHIETTMTEIAQRAGVITYRDKQYRVLAGELKDLIDPKSPIQNDLRKTILSEAEYILGSDGAHSIVRQEATPNKMRDDETKHYLVELKYDTHGKAEPRGVWESSVETSKGGRIDIETMSKNKTEKDKPVTLHIFVDEDAYNALRIKDAQGKMKGVFGNSWKMTELKELGKTNKKVKQVYRMCRHHIKQAAKRGGKCDKEEISTLEMRCYCAAESVALYKGKKIILIGDANSGVILETGFKKALHEIPHFVRQMVAVHDSKLKFIDEIPPQLLAYQDSVRKIYDEVKGSIEVKSYLIKKANAKVGYLASSSKLSDSEDSTDEREISSVKETSSGCNLV